MMSGRQRTSGGTAGRPRQHNRLVYEDFQPQTDTNEEEGARVVVLHVPGFLKEQMRITAEQASNVRVHGQRPLLNNRCSRFNVLLPVPQNCSVHKIHAKFQNGILTITMPKDVLQTALPLSMAEKPAEKTTREDIRETLPPKATEGKVVPPPVLEPNQKAATEAEVREQKNQEKALQKAAKDERQKNDRDTPTSIEKIPQKTDSGAQKGEKGSGETASRNEKPKDVKNISQGQKDDRVDKQREIGGQTKGLDSGDPLKTLSEKIQPKAQSGQEAISSRQIYVDKKNSNEMLKELEKGGKVAEKSSEKGEESTQKGRESANAPQAKVVAVSKSSDDGKKAVKILASGAANEDGGATNGNKLGIKHIAETAKQTMTNVVKKLNEDDRQMLINISAAVLVLVALGAYISFGNFGSSAENEH